MDNDKGTLINLTLLGDSLVGKTCILNRFAKDIFINTILTVGMEFAEKSEFFAGRQYLIRLLDTVGQEKYRSMVSSFFKNADGMFIVYDVTSQSSFDNVSYWLDQIKENNSNDIPIMLVGNKTDLIKVIQTEDGVKKANESKTDFCEVSALNGSNINNAIMSLAEKVIERKKVQTSTKISYLNPNDKNSFCCNN